MNPEVKERWIAALKSGEYKQGFKALKTRVDGEDRHCCLGVLCELYLAEHPEAGSWVDPSSDNKYTLSLEGIETSTALGFKVRKWARVSGLGNYIPGGYLSDLNDNGMSFENIADVIEEYF